MERKESFNHVTRISYSDLGKVAGVIFDAPMVLLKNGLDEVDVEKWELKKETTIEILNDPNADLLQKNYAARKLTRICNDLKHKFLPDTGATHTLNGLKTADLAAQLNIVKLADEGVANIASRLLTGQQSYIDTDINGVTISWF